MGLNLPGGFWTIQPSCGVDICGLNDVSCAWHGSCGLTYGMPIVIFCDCRSAWKYKPMKFSGISAWCLIVLGPEATAAESLVRFSDSAFSHYNQPQIL